MVHFSLVLFLATLSRWTPREIESSSPGSARSEKLVHTCITRRNQILVVRCNAVPSTISLSLRTFLPDLA